MTCSSRGAETLGGLELREFHREINNGKEGFGGLERALGERAFLSQIRVTPSAASYLGGTWDTAHTPSLACLFACRTLGGGGGVGEKACEFPNPPALSYFWISLESGFSPLPAGVLLMWFPEGNFELPDAFSLWPLDCVSLPPAPLRKPSRR